MGARIGIAVLGLGVIGRRMLEQTAGRGDVEVVAAWDLHPGAREAAARDFPGTPIAASAAQAVAHPRTQVVYIGTPPAAHREYSLLAAEHRRMVFCEKPLAVDLDEGAALVTEMRERAVPNAVNFVFASAPGARALASQLASGAIGRPVGIETRLFFSKWPRDWQANAQWLRLRAEGGFVREVLSHFVYLMIDLFGDCRHVGSVVEHPADPSLCERAAVAVLDCAGIASTVSASAGGAGPDEVSFTVRGERGALRLENWHALSVSQGDAWQPVSVPFAPHPDLRIAAYQCQIDSLACMARGQPHRLPDMAVALRVQRVIEQVLRGA